MHVHTFLKKMIKHTEGRFLFYGAALGIAHVIFLGIAFLFLPEMSQILLGMTAINVIFGRAASISFGYTMGIDPVLGALSSMMVETILVLIFYPLFVLTWKHLIQIQSLQKLMDRLTAAAEKNQEKIKRFGPIGLLIFVWFPFWMTGPVVGCIIGFLIKLKPRINLSVVLTGTYLATICWSFFLRRLHVRAAMYNPYAPTILLMILIMFAIFGILKSGDSDRHR